MEMFTKYRVVLVIVGVLQILLAVFIGTDSAAKMLVASSLALFFFSFMLSEIRASQIEKMLKRYEEPFGKYEVSHFILGALEERRDFPDFVLRTLKEELEKLSLERRMCDSINKREDLGEDVLRNAKLRLHSHEQKIWKLRDSLVNHLGYKLSDDFDELTLQVRAWLS